MSNIKCIYKEQQRDHEKIHCSPNTDAVDPMHNTMPPLCGCRLFHVKLMRQVCISYKEYYAVNNCNWIGNNYTSRMLPNSRKCREGNLILFLFVAFFRLLLPWFVHIPRLFTIRTNHNWYTHSNFLAQRTHRLLILVVVSFWRFVLLIILLCYTHMIIRTIIFIIIRRIFHS